MTSSKYRSLPDERCSSYAAYREVPGDRPSQVAVEFMYCKLGDKLIEHFQVEQRP